MPAIRDGQWWRWFTSIYVHQNVQHIVANMLLFLSLVSHLELNYGWWRLTLVWIISGAMTSPTFISLKSRRHACRETKYIRRTRVPIDDVPCSASPL